LNTNTESVIETKLGELNPQAIVIWNIFRKSSNSNEMK